MSEKVHRGSRINGTVGITSQNGMLVRSHRHFAK